MLMTNEVMEIFKKREAKLGKSKLYINPTIIMEHLKNYEVDFEKIFSEHKTEIMEQLDIENFSDAMYQWDGQIVQTLIDIGLVDEDDRCTDQFNSYNWNCQTVFQGSSFEYNDKYYLILTFHINGDVRCNYSPCILYEFDYEEDFNEKVLFNSQLCEGIIVIVEGNECVVETNLSYEYGYVTVYNYNTGHDYEFFLDADFEDEEGIKEEVEKRILGEC